MFEKIGPILVAAIMLLGIAIVKIEPPTSSVVEFSKNAVVLVVSPKGIGTGFFIGENMIITNDHVIHGGEGVIKVASKSLRDDYEVTVKWTDASADIAVLEIKDWEKYKADNPETTYLSLDTTYSQGDKTIVLGHPSGLMFSAAQGIISLERWRISPDNPKFFISTDAHLYQGNSGGPVLDADGDVIGVSDIMLTVPGGSYGFAIPAVIVEKVLSDFVKYGEVRWALLGIVLEDNTIKSVSPGGAGEAGGLKAGDVIQNIVIDGRVVNVKIAEDLINEMAIIDYDTKITFVLQDRQVEVTPKYRTSKDFQKLNTE